MESKEKVRLQKYFSDMGIMSRRAAEAEIERGNVRVNGETATLGMKIDSDTDTVEYKGRVIRPKVLDKKYVLLNKPRGYVTTTHDEKGRADVTDLVKIDGIRLYPVGRLDMDSDGLLLLTNDGELTNRLTHPRHEIPKVYHVTVRGKVNGETVKRLSEEMVIDGYKILPVETELLASDGDTSTLKMTLYEGRNRQIRKMCATEDLEVARLTRVAIGDIHIDKLPLGSWRYLTDAETDYLKNTTNKKED